MSDRADFKNSIRNLAQVLHDEPEPSAKTIEPQQEPIAATIQRPRPPRAITKSQTRAAKGMQIEKANFKMVSSLYPIYLEELIAKASHLQRAKGLFPGKKQDIRIEAAKEWLVRNGYLGGVDDPETSSD